MDRFQQRRRAADRADRRSERAQHYHRRRARAAARSIIATSPFRIVVLAPSNPADLNPSPDPFATDLAHAFRSITRKDNAVNRQPSGPIATGSPFLFPGPFTDAQPLDPYTPLLRAYENDRVQIRTLVGAHHLPHVFNLQGLMWQTEVDVANSGFRANQVMSISEHFEMNFTVPPATVNNAVAGSGDPPSTDYLYQPSADIIGTSDGAWGLLRSYRGTATELASLPANPPSTNPVRAQEIQDLLANAGNKRTLRKYTVVAVTIQQALEGNAAGLVVQQPGGNRYFRPERDASMCSRPIFRPTTHSWTRIARLSRWSCEPMPAT